MPVVVQPYQKKYLEMLFSGRAKQGSAKLVKSGKDWYIHLSLTVIDFAIAGGVTKIRLEDLTGARWANPQRKEQRKDRGRCLHCWPYYQLIVFSTLSRSSAFQNPAKMV